MSFIDAVRSEIDRAVTRLASSLVRRGLIGTAPNSTYFFQVTGDDSSETFENVELQQHYGFASRPPAGGECIVVCPGGEGAGGVSIAEQDRAHRPTLSAAGDVVLYGTKGTGQPSVLLATGGQITITSGGATPGTVVLKADGSIQVTAGAGKTVDVGGATDFQLLGTTLKTALLAFCVTGMAAVPALEPALIAACTALNTALASVLSAKAKVG